MTENQKVFKYLERGRALTCAEAISLGLSYNLRSRISNLIDQGHKIKKRYIQVKRKDGTMATVREYRL